MSLVGSLTERLNGLWGEIDTLQSLNSRDDVKRELALAKTHLEDAGSRLLRAKAVAATGLPGAAHNGEEQ